jgi:predicted nicotinamide N-methyase
MSDAPISDEKRFTSRFETRIHILDIGAPPVRQIQLLAPKDPDSLLDDEITLARYRADDYMPYWPIIWPSGLMLAHQILTADGAPPRPFGGGRCIELGCGLGTTGICAGLRGWHVTLTDYDPEAIDFAGHNALRNGVPAERIRPLHMDWRKPIDEKFPWVIASDVLYERRLHPLLLGAIGALRGEVTVLMIAHRLSAIRWANQIYVLEDGAVVESGAWDDLNERRGGRFRALCEAHRLVA